MRVNTKMYLVVDEDLYKKHRGLVINSIAHASLIAHLKWENRYEKAIYQGWLKYSFRKVTVTADKETMEEIRQSMTTVDVTESALDNNVTLLVVHPRHFDSPILEELKLLK